VRAEHWRRGHNAAHSSAFVLLGARARRAAANADHQHQRSPIGRRRLRARAAAASRVQNAFATGAELTLRRRCSERHLPSWDSITATVSAGFSTSTISFA